MDSNGVAKELMKAAKDVLAFRTHVAIRTPAARLFENVDFSFNKFVEDLQEMLGDEGTVVRQDVRGGKWEIIIEFPDVMKASIFLHQKLGKWNEFGHIQEYGAKADIE